ncbi:hypothetical protein ABFV47_27120 [Mycolicibacterium fortuitum]|uniref:hypothetical protein n=1 Tax=Mycolicibacterium fortuitum TaxID=1766 RepID=UPI000A9B8B75|nr:hypothetical protein [Mycolicibacterium fortuitum]
MTNLNLRDFASPIPDPVPKPEPSGGQYRGLASGLPADPKAETKTEPKPDTKPDTEQKPDGDKASEPKPNRDGKVVADTKPVPDAAEKPDPKPEPEEKAKPSAASKFARAAGIPKDMPRHPIKGMSALVKAQWTAGADISEKLAGKLGAKGTLKTAARLIPGVGTAVGLYSAWNNAKSGDYVGAALNLVGSIPGPIGWVGLGASAAWEMFDGGGGKLGQWDQPDGSSTFILPGAAKDVGGVTALDQQLREAQQLVFSFQDGPKGRVWDSNPPEGLRLDGADIQKELTEALGGISDLFAEVDRVMSSAGEAYFDEYRSRLQPHLDAMAALKEQVKPFTQQLTAASDGASTAYTAVLDANRSAREQLSNNSKLSDQGPAVSFTSAVSAAGSQVIAADRNISEMFGEPAAVLTAAVATGTGTKVDPNKETKPVATPAPAAQTPVTTSPAMPAKTEAPQKQTDPLSDLMKALNQKTATPSTPSMPNLGNSGLGGGSPVGTGGGSPLSSQPSKPVDTGSDKKLDDSKKGDEKKTERKLDDPRKDKEEKKATPLSASKTDNKVTPEPKLTAEQKPGAHTVVPAQPSAETAGNPAAPAAQAPAAPPEPSKEVDVKGNKTTFPDAKTAKMAQLLAAADPAHPLSLADAAKLAGLTPPVPGQDPGSQVAPAQAKPGDLLVAGDKSYLLLGDGKFYDLQEYKVVSADQLPQDMGSRGGYFHLNDPSPTGAPGAQPVSGQTPGGVDQQVPGGTPAPSAPTDASSPKPADPAPGAPAPAPAGGVPSAGTPGAPKPAPSGGPASAESTATGTAQPSPSPSTSALDPNAVR